MLSALTSTEAAVSSLRSRANVTSPLVAPPLNPLPAVTDSISPAEVVLVIVNVPAASLYDKLIPEPAVTSSTLLLKSDQSVDESLPVFVALATGIFSVISPLLVIGLPETLISVPPSAVQKPTFVTVPKQLVLELNAVQSALDKAPRLVALAVGKLNVISPESVIGLPETLKSVPAGNKGLKKLPTQVRNKMGFMKKGGKVK